MTGVAPPQETQRRRPPFWVWLIVASCAILVAATAFATVVFLLPGATESTPEPSNTSKPAATTEPTKTPAPEATPAVPAPIVLPDCETLWPDRYAVAKAYAENYPSEILCDDIGDYRFSDRFGPAAQTALSQSTQTRGCAYVANSETFIHTNITEVTGASKEALIAALRADGDFVESTIDGALAFEWQRYQNGHWDYAYTTHTFIGDVWIAGFGPQPATDYVPQFAAAILSANPTLQ